MDKTKFDLVIEAVRYNSSGQVELARVYERRGAAFSDRLLFQRSDLLSCLKGGKQVVIGQRKPTLGSSFDPGLRVKTYSSGLGEILSTQAESAQDHLEGAPLF